MAILRSLIVALPLFIFSFCYAQEGFAQNTDTVEKGKDEQRSYIQASLGKIFESYPDLDSLDLQYENSAPNYLELYFRRSSLENSRKKEIEKYDLEFEGDKYILRKRNRLMPESFCRLIASINTFLIKGHGQ